MGWRLKVSGYGKIESAEIETAPLTLFVGDNNSGKGYLMSGRPVESIIDSHKKWVRGIQVFFGQSCGVGHRSDFRKYFSGSKKNTHGKISVYLNG